MTGVWQAAGAASSVLWRCSLAHHMQSQDERGKDMVFSVDSGCALARAILRSTEWISIQVCLLVCW